MLNTEVVKPRMTGPELAAQLTEQRPKLRMLYMSGTHLERLRGITAGRFHGVAAGQALQPHRSAQLRTVHEILNKN